MSATIADMESTQRNPYTLLRSTLEGDLWAAGHEVDLPDPLTVGQLESLCQLLGVRVSDFLERCEGGRP